MKSHCTDCSRRGMLRSMVAGSMLMPGILSELLAADAPPAEADPLAPRLPFSGAGEAGDLSSYERWRVARRHLRSQAEADDRSRKGDQARSPRDEQPRRLQPAFPQEASMGIPASRQMRHGSQHALSEHGRVRGRYCPDPVNEHEPFESLQRHAGHAHRFIQLRPPEHRLLGELRPGDDERQSPLLRRHCAANAVCRQSGLGRRFPSRRHQGTLVVPGAEPIANIGRRTPTQRQRNDRVGGNETR